MKIYGIQPYISRAVTFKAGNNTVSDKDKGIRYAQDLHAALPTMEYQAFYDTISKVMHENDAVKSAFLLWKPSDIDDNIFGLALKEDQFMGEDIFEFVKGCDEETQKKFLFGGKKEDSNFSPYVVALRYGDEELAYNILDWVRTFDNPTQKKFFESDVYETIMDFNERGLKMQGLFEDRRDMFHGKDPFGHVVKLTDREKSILGDIKKIPPNVPLVDDDEKAKKPNNRFRIHKEVKTRFTDVGGLFNVKKQIEEELLGLLKNPRVKNSDKPGGIMLYGPPGTGKTLLATAIAGEAGLPFISSNGSSFTELYVGAGPKHVRELYAEARKLAAGHPSKTAIVFIDEVDALASKRGGSSNSERDATLNAVLSELDGVNAKEDDGIKLITICATNRKDMLDDAFTRAGRMDLEFEVDDPSQSPRARRAILDIHANGKPFESDEIKEEILNELAQTTAGFSGAGLADLMKRAYRKTLYLDRQNTAYITQKDVADAKLEVLAGIKNDAEFNMKDLKITVTHEGGHAMNAIVMNDAFKDSADHRLMPRRKLDFIVNESHGSALGITFTKPSEENKHLTVESLLSDVVVTYGGYSMEQAVYGTHDAGVSGDLNNNTERIVQAVTKYGLGSKTKFIGCAEGVTFELFKSDIKSDIENYSNTGMNISNQIAQFTRPFIEQYTQEFANATDDKAKIIQGDVFEGMFNKWLDDNNKRADYAELCKQIRFSVEKFKGNL